MMNNKGQTLIIFIVFIPLFLLLAAFVIDIGYLFEAQSNLEGVSKTIVNEALTKNLNEDQIEELFKKNDIDAKNLKVNKTDNEVSISITDYKPSIFGSIIGIKEYKIKANIRGEYINNKVIIKKE